MERTRFEELQVYQLAEKLADQIWQIVAAWDRFAKDTVGKQLVRAVDSIGANIAEGSGRHNFQDNQRFVKILIGSLHKKRHWLRLSYTRNLLTSQQVNTLKLIID